MAGPCGFAVEGMGFFHIPHESSVKQRTEAWTELITVTDGELSVENVISELQRLILGGWVWSVEAVGNNSFHTVFPSCPELLRMVEWGWSIQNSRTQSYRLKSAWWTMRCGMYCQKCGPNLSGYHLILGIT
jgi:hypothetical protein